MFVAELARFLAPASLCALLALGGCGQDEQVGDAGPAISHVTGCGRIATTVEGSTCRVQWNCTDGGSHVLLCAEVEDGSTQCLCSVGEDEGEDGGIAEPMAAPGGCGQEPYEDAAFSVCAWSLE